MNEIIAGLAVPAPLSVFIAGVVLIWRGDRIKFFQRRCPCGYELRGLPPSVLRCPECGAPREFSRKRLWSRGDRAIIVGIICIVVSVLLSPLAYLGAVFLIDSLMYCSGLLQWRRAALGDAVTASRLPTSLITSAPDSR